MPTFPAFKTKPYYDALKAWLTTSLNEDGTLRSDAVRAEVSAAIADNQTVVDAAAAAVDANPTIADHETRLAATQGAIRRPRAWGQGTAILPTFTPGLFLRPGETRDEAGTVTITESASTTTAAGEYGNAWRVTVAAPATVYGLNDIPYGGAATSAQGTLVGKFKIDAASDAVYLMGWDFEASGVWCRYNLTTQQLTWRVGNGSATTGGINLGAWGDVAIAWAGGYATLLINGEVAGAIEYATAPTTPITSAAVAVAGQTMDAWCEYHLVYGERVPDDVLADLAGRTASLTWANVPTATAGGLSLNAALPGGTEIAYNDPRFRFFSGRPVAKTLGGKTYYSAQTSLNAPWTPMGREFMLDATSFAASFVQENTSATLDLRVDGVSLTGGPVTFPDMSVGGEFWVRVDFGARAIRHIEMVSEFIHFGRVQIAPTASLWPPSTARTPRVLILGDSFTAGGGTTFADGGSWIYAMAERMGWADVWNAGVGGTGYLAPGNPAIGGRPFRDRVPDDIAPSGAEIVIVQGSTNDQAYTASAVGDEAALLYADIRAALPDAALIVIPPFEVGGSVSAENQANNAAIVAAATGVADLVVNPYTEGWFTGSGRVGAEAGDGNADVYKSTDGIHPSQAGHDYIGQRVADTIMAGSSL